MSTIGECRFKEKRFQMPLELFSVRNFLFWTKQHQTTTLSKQHYLNLSKQNNWVLCKY